MKPIINQHYIDMKKELLELRKAYDIAMLEINRLGKKREYWENKFKKLEQTQTQEAEKK